MMRRPARRRDRPLRFTPVGYADAQGRPHSNPPPRIAVSAEALFVLVDEAQRATDAALQKLLDGLARGRGPDAAPISGRSA